MTRPRTVAGALVALAAMAAFVLTFERPAYDAGYRLGHALRGAR